MKVCAITATAGRMTCLSRNVRMFLDQEYENCVQLIYQNASRYITLDESIPKNKVILVNNHLDSITKQPYRTLGAIYNDALKYVPEDVDIITHMDDDDLFIPTHISEGVKGIIRGNKTAYKPKYSWFLSQTHKKGLMENTMEPSIFVKAAHVRKFGYSNETTAQHLQWLNPLVNSEDIFVDPEGPPTMLYDWNTTGMPQIWKTSGDPNNPENMDNYRRNSTDFGNNVLMPFTKERIEKYYKLIRGQ